MKFANECYTWFMKDSGAYWENQLEHMIRVTAEAGMQGVEPIFSWMGDLADPHRLKDALQKYGIELAAIAFVQDWNLPEETVQEREDAERAFELLSHFPGAKLLTVQMPTGRHGVEERRLNLIKNINAVSMRAADRGISATFHPNSPETSITRTLEDYEILLDKLDSSVSGWTPDVGHLINGGMGPLEMMKRYEQLINFVHFKDWDGNPEFALMGQGKVDLVGITQWLAGRDYDGWIVCEDEAPEAVDNPDGVTMHDGQWIRETLLPTIQKKAKTGA